MSVKKDSILITGANGFLGQCLRILLEKHKFFIIATGLGHDRLLNHNHIYVDLDISSLERCDAVLSEYSPSVIINTAAFTNVDECEIKKSKCKSINADGVKNFIPYLEKNNSHFIQMSTDFVFDGCSNSGYCEKDVCNPINFYGFSKLQAENILINTCLTYTIIRTSLVYGPSGSNFFTRIKTQLERQVDLNIVDDQYRTPTYVLDLCLAILKIIQLKKYGLYHISSAESLSIFQIVCNIAEYLNLDHSNINRIKSKELNQIAKRPADSTLSIEKAIKDFDFIPTQLNNALNNML